MATYLTYEVFDITPSGSVRAVKRNDFTLIGQSYHARTKVAREKVQDFLTYTIILASNSEVQALENFFDARRGPLGAFWMPTFIKDLEIALDISAPNGSITVRNFSAIVESFTNKNKHVRFPRTAEFTRLATPTDSGGNGACAITPSISVDLLENDSVEYLRLVRFQDDDLKVVGSPLGPDIFEATFTVKEIQGETA